jgi:hypothetical protein
MVAPKIQAWEAARKQAEKEEEERRAKAKL